MAALGNTAICDTLIAQHTDIPFSGTGAMHTHITFADNGKNLPTKGLFLVTTVGGATTMTLPDGVNQGDVVEIIYYHSGGNTFDLNVPNLHGANKTISVGTASGQYYKLVWIDTWFGWCLTARESSSDATATTVEFLPAIA